MISNIIAFVLAIFALSWALGLIKAIADPNWYWDKKFNETGLYGSGFPKSLFITKIIQLSISGIIIYFLIHQSW